MTDSTFDLKGTNIYLIGMMGAGKSTAGQVLAQRLGYQFFDTDAVITQAAGCSISQIFAESGEAVFRNLETQVLSQLAAHRRLVVATGGGIVLERMNWSHLRHGLIVWLNPTLETLWQRLQTDTTRPLLQDSNPRQTLEQLLMQRQPLYQQADLCIEVTPEDDAETVVQQIIEAIPGVIKPTAQALNAPASAVSSASNLEPCAESHNSLF